MPFGLVSPDIEQTPALATGKAPAPGNVAGTAGARDLLATEEDVAEIKLADPARLPKAAPLPPGCAAVSMVPGVDAFGYAGPVCTAPPRCMPSSSFHLPRT